MVTGRGSGVAGRGSRVEGRGLYVAGAGRQSSVGKMILREIQVRVRGR